MVREYISNNIVVKLTFYGQVSSPINNERKVRGKSQICVIDIYAYNHT